jgi:hypothetical protein
VPGTSGLVVLLVLGLCACSGGNNAGFDWVSSDNDIGSDNEETNDDDTAGDDDDTGDDDTGGDDEETNNDDAEGEDEETNGDEGTQGDDDSAGDDDDSSHDVTVTYPPATEEQLNNYGVYFPGFASAYSYALPHALLPQIDIDRNNVEVLVFHDEHLQPLGFVREVFTDVDCISGVCDAIRVTFIFDPDLNCTNIFDAPGASHPLKKFVEQGGYINFDSDDMVLLRSLVLSPPQAMLDAPTTDSLVSGSHATAATLQEYTSFVVLGGAFTTWKVIQYSVTTRTLLESQAAAFSLGGAP